MTSAGILVVAGDSGRRLWEANPGFSGRDLIFLSSLLLPGLKSSNGTNRKSLKEF